VACCIADACLKLVDGLLPSSLRRDEPKDDGLVVRYRGKWLESTGALVVVFEEEPLGADVGEQALREPVVAALDQPAALLVAATKMEAERNAGTLSEDDVIKLEPEIEPALDRPSSALIEVAIGGIKQERIVGSVELDVLAAEPHELVDLLTKDLGDVGQEALQGRIGTAGALRIVEVGKQARAGRRDLDDPLRPSARVSELLGGEEATAPELAEDGDRRALDALVPDLVAMPVAPQERVEVPVAEALDRLRELA
jgi:hypothetical protein